MLSTLKTILIKKFIVLFGMLMISNNLEASRSKSYIERAWGLKNIKRISKLGGFSAKNLLLENEDGQYILKKIKREKIKSPSYIFEGGRILEQQGLPVPHFLKTYNNSYFLDSKESYYMLYKRIEGTRLHETSFQENSLQDTGRKLAILHKTPLPLFLSKIEENISSNLILQFHKKLENILIETDELEIIKKSLYQKARTIEEVQNYKISNDNLTRIKYSFVHGDFHNENLLFSTDHRLTGILDLEKIHIGDGLSDVFHFIRLACCNTGYTLKNIEKAKIFIQAYLQDMPYSSKYIEKSYYNYIINQCNSVFFENLFINDRNLFWLELIKRDLKNLEFLINNKVTFLNEITR